MPAKSTQPDGKLEHLKHLYGLEYEMVRATAAFEHAALRSLFILNGGALVAYLALFGALRRNPGMPDGIDWSIGKYAVWLWIVGLVLAAITAFLGARSQFSFRKLRSYEITQAEAELGLSSASPVEAAQASGKYFNQGDCYRKVAVVMGLFSFVLFIVGFWPGFLSIN